MSESATAKLRIRRHARKRGEQRFQIRLSKGQLSLLARRIQGSDLPEHRGKARFVRKLSKTRAFWYVLHETGEWLPVLYSKTTKSIVTILPPRSLGPVPNL